MPINSFDDYPMSWRPQLNKLTSTVPVYIMIADKLDADIKEGVLSPGTKLPPQRELADFLDVNLSTVSRAFKRCMQKGLICATVGSGTFVASDVAVNTMLLHTHYSNEIIEMGSIFPDNTVNDEVATYLRRLLAEPDVGKLFQYGRPEGTLWQKEAAMKLMARAGFKTEPQHVLLSGGGQNAITAALAGLFQPGDKIGTDPVTYPGIKTAASMLGIQLVPIQQRNREITQEGLQHACKNENIRGLYLIPDFHNPTTHTMSVDTRRMIGEMAKKENLIVIEDAIYGLLGKQSISPIACFAPENVIYVSSLSKVISPGLRLGFVAVPDKYRKNLEKALYNMNISVSPIMAELAARMIHAGVADSILEKHRAYTKEQNARVDHYLGSYTIEGSSESIFRWLILPEKFTGESFELCAYHAGIQVYAAERFVVGNTKPERAVRIAVNAPRNSSELEAGLERILSLLESDSEYRTFY